MIRKLNFSIGIIFFLMANISILNCNENGREKNSLNIKPQRICYRPITFGSLRKRLTLEYIKKHYNPEAENILIIPRIIVVHWTATATLKELFDAFNPEVLPKYRKYIKRGGRVNVSSQYVVDRDGTIYQLMPDNRMARHVIGLNHCSIGIENVGGPKWPLTFEQLKANAWLIKYLSGKYTTVKYVIGHHEYLKFRKHKLWIERDPDYITYKIDPGRKYMQKLRKMLKEMGLYFM